MPRKDGKALSVTYAALIWVGIILAVFGALVALFGVGEMIPIEIEVRYGDFYFKTTQIKATEIGLAILLIGSTMSCVVALLIPKGVRVLGPGAGFNFNVRLARQVTGPAALAALLAFVLLVLPFLYR